MIFFAFHLCSLLLVCKVTFSKRHLTVVPILVLLSMYVPFEQGYKSAQPFQRNRIWIMDFR